MTNIKLFSQMIFSKYISSIKEYFELIQKSESVKNIVNVQFTLLIGLNALHRVFEVVLLKTKNIEIAYYYSQKSFNYYLEYMEQIHAADLLSSLNRMDAILFVYKKTICEVCEKDQHNNNKYEDDTVEIGEAELRNIMNQIFRFTNTLFFWENNNINFENRASLSQFVYKHELMYEKCINMTNYLEVVQKETNMHYEKYEDIVLELSKLISRKRSASITNRNELILLKIHNDYETFTTKFRDASTKDLVKWLIV